MSFLATKPQEMNSPPFLAALCTPDAVISGQPAGCDGGGWLRAGLNQSDRPFYQRWRNTWIRAFPVPLYPGRQWRPGRSIVRTEGNKAFGIPERNSLNSYPIHLTPVSFLAQSRPVAHSHSVFRIRVEHARPEHPLARFRSFFE
jgi:hypothetical protein